MNDTSFFPRILIMTEDLSEIVQPLVSNYFVVGIVKTQRKNRKENYFSKVIKNTYRFLKPNPLKKFSKKNAISYYLMNNGSDRFLESWVKGQKPDLIVIYSMPELLKANIFNIPTYKTINLHPSLLPKYRGANPFFWHYYHHEKKGGVTVHFIDEGEDTGNIIYQEEYFIERGMSLVDMKHLAIEKIGIKLLFKTIDNIKNIPNTAQSKTHSFRARYLSKNEYKSLINWEEMEVEYIWHIFRGFPEWIKTLTFVGFINKCYFWKIKHYQKENMEGYRLGELYKEDNAYFISCKDGKIFISSKGFRLIR